MNLHMKRLSRFILICICFLSLELASALAPTATRSANLTQASDTLQSSRLSFFGTVGSGTTVGGTEVYIDTPATAPRNSATTANLHDGDTVHIGSHDYTISTIVSATEFTVTSAILSGDATAGTTVMYVAQAPQHVITFHTASAVPNGFFEVMIPAGTDSAGGGTDGVPDSDGFDFNSVSSMSAQINSLYSFDSSTFVSTASGGTGCTSGYQCFQFNYNGTGGVDETLVLKIGQTDGTNDLIVPGPSSSHSSGTSDSYSIIIKNFSNGADPANATPVDSVTAAIGVIESVRVTATVAPTITFSITGVASSQTVCGTGSTTDIDTSTATNAPFAVPFGTLSLNTFKTAAHLLTVSTNAYYGYAVTAIENDQLGLGGATTPYIKDTDCNATGCTEDVQQSWTTATGYDGFGYTLATGSGTPSMEFVNDDAFKARKFPATADSETPKRIMYDTTVADGDTGYVCYRISVNATQAAGDYENLITYTATATF